MKLKFDELSEHEKKIINEVWNHRTRFVQWPTKAIVLWDECVRVGYHHYPEEIKNKLKSKGIRIDSRSNGPAVMSFLFAGGRRPKRTSDPKQEWHVHHIYDGKFPWTDNRDTLHAVQNGKHFTQSAGLVAIHPIAEALADEYFYFAWLLRYESYLKFSYDPDMVFCGGTDEYGFKI
jgi:hypothetical protein